MLPADGPGAEGFSNFNLIILIISGPVFLSWIIGGGWIIAGAIALFTSFPLLAGFWYFSSILTPRRNEKVKYPGRPIEDYLTFAKKSDVAKYHGNKIPIDTFQEMYFNGDVKFNGDCLEVLEYRHDWANFRFTLRLFQYFLLGFIPEMLLHTRSQGTSYSTFQNPVKRYL